MTFDDRMRTAAAEVRTAVSGRRLPFAHVARRVVTRRIVAVAATAVFLVGVVGIAALAFGGLGGTAAPVGVVTTTDAPLDTTPQQSPTTMGEGPAGFVPATQTTDGTTSMPITFPDGVRVEVAYESWLKVAEMGMSAQLVLRVTTGQHSGCGALVDVRQDGHPYDPQSPVVQAFARPVGGEALLRESTGPASALLVMSVDAWELAIPFSENDACPPSDVGPIWAASIRADTTTDGFVTLTASRPVEVDTGFVGAAGLPTVTFGAGGPNSVTLTRGDCVPGSIEMLDTVPPYVGFCAADGEVRVSAQGSVDFLRGLTDSLRVSAEPND